MRYFFHIGYNGTNYHGWQKLPHNNSAQAIIEKSLSRILKQEVHVIGCGRTDTQVHASQYFFHIDTDQNNISDLRFRLNKTLPDDIAVFDIINVNDQAHSRLHATARTYNYFTHFNKDPFLNNLSALYHNIEFDVKAMQRAASLLCHYQDFKAFYRTASKPKNTMCLVTNAKWFVDRKGDRLKFTITANRFLSGMVRIIVHRLLEVGTNKLTLTEFESYLTGERIPPHVKSAYPQGLYLSKVTYPFLDIAPKSLIHKWVDHDGMWEEV